VVGSEVHELHRSDPRTLIRSGVAERIASQARQLGADLLVIDAELSPSQTRNLEDATGLPVADREAVILNVFERVTVRLLP
jgi:GTPase